MKATTLSEKAAEEISSSTDFSKVQFFGNRTLGVTPLVGGIDASGRLFSSRQPSSPLLL